MSQRFLVEFNMDLFFRAGENPEEFVNSLDFTMQDCGVGRRNFNADKYGITYKYHRHHSDESPVDVYEKSPPDQWHKFVNKINKITKKNKAIADGCLNKEGE